MKEDDVYRHYEGRFYKIVSIRVEAGKEIIRFISPRGNRNQLTKRQFENPVEVEGGHITRFKKANNDPENPWRSS